MNKSKFIIKLISAVGAAAIATTCVAGSASAVRVGTLESGPDCYELGLERRIENIDSDISDIIDKLDDMRRQVSDLSNSHEDFSYYLKKIKNTEKSLNALKQLRLTGSRMIKRVGSYLDMIKYGLGALSGALTDFQNGKKNIVDLENMFNASFWSDDDGIEYWALRIKNIVEFSNQLNEKYLELRKANVSTKKVNNENERERLRKLFGEAEDYYKSKIPNIFPSKRGQEQKNEFFDLANKAINEINKALDANQNNDKPVNLTKKENSEEVRKKKNELENKLKDAQNALKKCDIERYRLNKMIDQGDKEILRLNKKMKEKYAKVNDSSDDKLIMEKIALDDKIDKVESKVNNVKSKGEELNKQKELLEKNINDIKSQLEKLK